MESPVTLQRSPDTRNEAPTLVRGQTEWQNPAPAPPPPISQGHRFLPISVFPIPTRRDFVVFSRVDKIPCGTGIMPVRFTERMVSSIFPKSFSSTPTHSSSQARRKRKLKSMQSGVHIFSWICTSHFAGVMSTSRARKEDCTNHIRSHSPTACVPGGKEQILSLFSNDSTEPQIRSVTSPGSRRKKELMPSEDPRPGACFLLPLGPSQCIHSGSLTWINGNEFQIHFLSEPGPSFPQTVCRHTYFVLLVP